MEKFKSSQSLNTACKLTYVHKSLLHSVASKGSKASLKKFLSSYSGLIDVLDSLGRTPLMYAMLSDKRESVILLKNAGANVNAKDLLGRTALHLAAEYELLEYIKLLVACGANAKLQDRDGVTALHICSVHSSPKCLKQMLQYYAPEEVDIQDNDLRTALHWSACCGNSAGIKLLLKHNCNIGIPDIKGMTPLHWAAISKNPKSADCVKYLLRNRPNVINWCDNDGQTAFHLAIYQNAETVLEELLSCRHGNVNVTDNKCRTPLHLASFFGLSNAVLILLKHNANIYSCDIEDSTALHYAAASNSVKCVELLSIEIDVNHKDSKGRTPAACAVSNGANDVIKILYSKGTDFLAMDEQGRTALHIAAAFGYETTVEILIDYNLDVNAVNASGQTPLFEACKRNHYKVAQILLKYGAKRDHTDNNGQTALHCAAAAAKDQKDSCQLLVSHGWSVDAMDIWGRTPLCYAAFANNLENVVYLIENGANEHHCDFEGFNGLHWACRKGHLEMVKCLMQYSVDPNTLKFGNRLTALDLACLGEHHRVTYYLLEHQALSTVHIENMAATKIQRAYRRYRKRLNKTKLPSSGDSFTTPNTLYKNVSPIRTDYERKTANSDDSFKISSFKRSDDKSGSSGASQSTSGVSCSESEHNLSAEIINFFHENPTRTINFNRKTELKGSTSTLNLTCTYGHSPHIRTIDKRAIEQSQTNTISLKNVFRQKNKKKTEIVQQKSQLYRHVFDSFVHHVVNLDTVRDRLIENSDSSNIDYENCHKLLLPCQELGETSDVPSWCSLNYLRNTASKEWLIALSTAEFKERWAFHQSQRLSNARF